MWPLACWAQSCTCQSYLLPRYSFWCLLLSNLFVWITLSKNCRGLIGSSCCEGSCCCSKEVAAWAFSAITKCAEHARRMLIAPVVTSTWDAWTQDIVGKEVVDDNLSFSWVNRWFLSVGWTRERSIGTILSWVTWWRLFKFHVVDLALRLLLLRPSLRVSFFNWFVEVLLTLILKHRRTVLCLHNRILFGSLLTHLNLLKFLVYEVVFLVSQK